jgi:Tol biopolymer transport system component
MGEVYKARDTRLDRVVALKISKDQFSQQFEHEAHAAALLNHPNICTLYDIGPNYLVMEFVDGQPLRGPMNAHQAVKLAIQIAAALDAAHRKGIVHRDLKPGNILVSKAGVKILDFGLAQIEAPRTNPVRSDAPPEEIATEEIWEQAGAFGTVLYMSPEQLQRKKTDFRTDIYSFGLVLYEMLTGKHPYQAENVAGLVGAMVGGPIPSVAEVATPALNRVVRKCLAVDPDERWQSAYDLRTNLEWVGLGIDQAEAAAPKGGTKSRTWWMATAAAALVALGLGAGVSYWMRPAPPDELVKLSLQPPEGTNISAGASGGPPALSPDGRKIAFVAEQSGNQVLWVRALDSLTARSLSGTEGARSPFWSPDGRTLGFFAQDKLRRIDENGGMAEAIANVPGNFAAAGVWGADGKILFTAGNLLTLFQVDVNGGQPVAVTKLEGRELGHFWPALLPDGRHFLYGAPNGGPVYVTNFSATERKQILDDAAHAVYVPLKSGPGYLVYVRKGSLMAQRFDTSSLQLLGEARLIAEGVEPAEFTVSNEGTLAFRSGEAMGAELNSFSRAGAPVASFGKQAGNPGEMRFSPNGRVVAVAQTVNRTTDIYLRDLERNTVSRLTFNGGRFPLWTSDGTRIVFDKPDGVYLKSASGGGDEQRIFEDSKENGAIRNMSDLSPDGQLLMVGRSDPKTGFDMWILHEPLSSSSTKKMVPFLQSPANEGQGRFSPTKPLRVAYTSEESGENEIYVANTPGLPAGKWQISTAGGYAPRWRHDGRELYFVGADLRSIMAADIEPGVVFRAGTPHVLFQAPSPIVGVATDMGFAVSPDGKTFVLALHAQDAGSSAIHVVLHWPEELRR